MNENDIINTVILVHPESCFCGVCQTKRHNDLVEKLKIHNNKMRECLQKIANEDFRGNRSQASVDAFKCLKELE